MKVGNFYVSFSSVYPMELEQCLALVTRWVFICEISEITDIPICKFGGIIGKIAGQNYNSHRVGQTTIGPVS